MKLPDDFPDPSHLIRYTEEADCQIDHRQEVAKLMDRALDFIAEAMDHNVSFTRAAIWNEVSICFREARHHALCSAAHDIRELVGINTRKGMKQCSHCKAWLPVDDLVGKEIVRTTKREGYKTTHWYTCTPCLRKIGAL